MALGANTEIILLDGFGDWFAGLVDGEGSFQITLDSRRGYVSVRFVIKLRADDRPVLEEIKRMLGCGFINRYEHNSSKPNGSKPMTSFIIDGAPMCQVVVDVLTQCTLHTRKLKDFQVWRKCVEKLRLYPQLGGRLSQRSYPENYQELLTLRSQLAKAREYQEVV